MLILHNDCGTSNPINSCPLLLQWIVTFLWQKWVHKFNWTKCDPIGQINFIQFSLQQVVNLLWQKWVEILRSNTTYLYLFCFFINFLFCLQLQSSRLCKIPLCQSELTGKECFTSMSQFRYGEIPLCQSKMAYCGYLETKMTICHGEIDKCHILVSFGIRMLALIFWF